MITQNYIITAAEGLHARPATALVKLAKKHTAVINIKKGERGIMLNSLINLLSLAIKGGDTISITIEGDDEAEAAIAINNFFNEELKNL